MKEILEKAEINYTKFAIIQALAWVGIFLVYDVSSVSVTYGIYASILVLISFIDAKTYTIPDKLNLIILIIAIISIAFPLELSIMSRVLGFFIISLPMLLLSMAVPGAFGGGDIKMMAASGLLLGMKATIVAGFVGIILGGIYGVYLLRVKKVGKGAHMAFGPSLCIGLYIAILYGEVLANWYMGLL